MWDNSINDTQTMLDKATLLASEIGKTAECSQKTHDDRVLFMAVTYLGKVMKHVLLDCAKDRKTMEIAFNGIEEDLEKLVTRRQKLFNIQKSPQGTLIDVTDDPEIVKLLMGVLHEKMNDDLKCPCPKCSAQRLNEKKSQGVNIPVE